MHEKLIAGLEEKHELDEKSCHKFGCSCDGLYGKAAAALREDAKTIAELTAENARLRKVIEEAIKHQEIVGGSLSKMSTTVRILRNALEGK